MIIKNNSICNIIIILLNNNQIIHFHQILILTTNKIYNIKCIHLKQQIPTRDNHTHQININIKNTNIYINKSNITNPHLVVNIRNGDRQICLINQINSSNLIIIVDQPHHVKNITNNNQLKNKKERWKIV